MGNMKNKYNEVEILITTEDIFELLKDNKIPTTQYNFDTALAFIQSELEMHNDNVVFSEILKDDLKSNRHDFDLIGKDKTYDERMRSERSKKAWITRKKNLKQR
ncbi:unnamed protein product [marine sediment metagenome]|uniref:Uncharacterized protein n=1 Tax=marine sediment metagenome TaxID=412755 RepID=X0U1E4_9ZZZZ